MHTVKGYYLVREAKPDNTYKIIYTDIVGELLL